MTRGHGGDSGEKGLRTQRDDTKKRKKTVEYGER